MILKKYYKKLVAERIYLSPVNVEDAEKYVEWFCDKDILAREFEGSYIKNKNI